MKKLILSIGFMILSLMIISQTFDVTVTGMVTDLNTGSPVIGQEIIIQTDSSSGGTAYYNTVYTNEAGVYNDSFSALTGEQGAVIISAYSCGTVMSNSAPYSQNSSQLVIDLQVCSDSTGNCEAIFTYYQVGDFDIQFTDLSIGDPVEWFWEFGDGFTSTEQNPLHTYSDFGAYNVTLTIISDPSQCISTSWKMVYVGDTIFPPECQASWWAYADSNSMYSMQFQDLSIAAGGISSWDWSFGDGTYSSEQFPVHTYQSGGYYEVCLTISDSSGSCQDTYCAEIYVGEWNPDCEAYFYYYPADTMGGGWNMNNIQFIDASIGDPNSWFWEFGDGQTSTEQNPTHYFSELGVYQVCLTITNDGDSCISTYCEMVEVYNDTLPGCITWFNLSVNNLDADFEAFSEGMQGDTEYFWTFGDSTTATGANVSHSYAESGYYFVTLTASSAYCTATYGEMIWVGELSFDVEGYVYLADSFQMADYADVHLMTFDTIGNGLIQVESTQVDATGKYVFEAVALENCVYFVQAELTDQSAYFGDYLPTYHLDALNWENAWPVFPFPMNWTYDIYMINSSSSNSGSGLITGTVTGETTRGAMEDVEMLLYNQNDEPLTYIRTNNLGEFDFNELAFGTYKLQTEMVGVTSDPFEITLSEEESSVSLNIVVHDGEAVLGVDEIQNAYIESLSEVFPNPVTEGSGFTIQLAESSRIIIDIYNQYGQKCGSEVHELRTGSTEVSIKTGSLSDGIYFLRITTTDETGLTRKFVKIR